MSTNIISLPYIKMVLNRINDYTANNQSGVDNIPHCNIKVKHSNGFAWFGVNILDFKKQQWTIFEEDEVKARLLASLNHLCDIVEIVTDMNRLIDAIKDIISERKQPTVYGGEGNLFIQNTLSNNIQMDIYRDDLPTDVLTYGGFAFDLHIDDRSLVGFLYHRGIIIYNYINETIARELVINSVIDQFGDIFDLTIADIGKDLDVTVFNTFKRQRTNTKHSH